MAYPFNGITHLLVTPPSGGGLLEHPPSNLSILAPRSKYHLLGYCLWLFLLACFHYTGSTGIVKKNLLHRL